MGTCCGTPYVKEEDTGSSFSRRSSILFEKFSRLSDYKKKYEFLSILGTGGFGKVRLYRDKKCPDMKFAIKTIKKILLTNMELPQLKEKLKSFEN